MKPDLIIQFNEEVTPLTKDEYMHPEAVGI